MSLLVDDFGGNEDSSDPYGDPARVMTRQKETEQVLRDVFPDGVDIHSFIVDRAEINHYNATDKDGLYGLYITRAISYVRSFLTAGQTMNELPEIRTHASLVKMMNWFSSDGYLPVSLRDSAIPL